MSLLQWRLLYSDKKEGATMDTWTCEQLEKQGIDPNTACDICPCNQGIDRGDAYTQGPCGQKQCWFTLGADDEGQ